MKACLLFLFAAIAFSEMITKKVLNVPDNIMFAGDLSESTVSSEIYDESLNITAYYKYNIKAILKIKEGSGLVRDVNQDDLNIICSYAKDPSYDFGEPTFSFTTFFWNTNSVPSDVSFPVNTAAEIKSIVLRGLELTGAENPNASISLWGICQDLSNSENKPQLNLINFPTYVQHAAYPDGTGASVPTCYGGDYNNGNTVSNYECNPCGKGYKCPFEIGNPDQTRTPCESYFYQDLIGQTECKVCIGDVTFSGPLHTGCNWICDYGFGCDQTPSYEHPPILCEEGWYSNTQAVEECKEAQPGDYIIKAEEDKYGYTKDVINVDVNACRIGYKCPNPTEPPEGCVGQEYQDETGQTECKVCPLIPIPSEEEPVNIGCKIECDPYFVLIDNKCYPGCGCKKEDLSNDFDWIVPSRVVVNGSIAYQYLEQGGYVVRECNKEMDETNFWNGNCTWTENIYHRNPFVTSTVSYDMLYDFTGISLETLNTYRYYIQRVFLRMFPEISFRFDVMGIHPSATVETFFNDIEKNMLFVRSDILGDRYLEARYPLEWLEDYQDRLTAMFQEIFGDKFEGAAVIPLQHSQHINNPDDSCIGYPYCEYDRRTSCTIAVGGCHDYDEERINVIQGELYEYHGVSEVTDCPWAEDKGYFVRKCSSSPYKQEWAMLDPTGMWPQGHPTDPEHEWISVTYEFHGLPYTYFTNNITYVTPSIFLKHASRSTIYDLFISPAYALNKWVPDVAEEDLEIDSAGINVRVEVDKTDAESVLYDMSTCDETNDDSYNVCARIEEDLQKLNTKFQVSYYITAKVIN